MRVIVQRAVNATVTIDGESVTITRPTGKLLELGRKVTA